MNKLLSMSVGIMLLLMLVSQAYEVSQDAIGVIPDSSYTFGELEDTYTVNGSQQTLLIGTPNLVLGISLSEGIMLTGIALGAFIFLIGIKVVDTGISEFAQRGLMNLALFGAVWGIFSVLTYDLVVDIPILGWITFFGISMLHFFGIVQQINGGNL